MTFSEKLLAHTTGQHEPLGDPECPACKRFPRTLVTSDSKLDASVVSQSGRSHLAQVTAERDALAAQIEALKQTGGLPLDEVWQKWQSIFTADPADILREREAVLMAENTELKSKIQAALDCYGSDPSLPLGVPRYKSADEFLVAIKRALTSSNKDGSISS